jgi:2-dehydropantoate 2-reductase
MEILIIGAGAMGGLFAALLAPRASVRLLTTNPDHARAIAHDGLTLTAMNGSLHRVPVRVLTEPVACDPPADLILVCTKARATEAAAATARRFLAEDGLVLTLQNGLGNLERIASVVGRARAAAGITAQAATLLAPGQVRHAGCGPTVLATAPGQSGQAATIAAIAALFNRAGIDTRISEDGEGLLWSKLIVNVGINALAALLRVPNGVLALVPACDLLMAQAVQEAVDVAKGLGIDLDSAAQLDRVRQVCALTSSNRASMLQDILRGAPTEIDVINGAIVTKGREVGVATPVNLLLTQLIKALEATADQRIASPSSPMNLSAAPMPKESLCLRTS